MTSSNPCVSAIADAIAALTGVPAAQLQVATPPRREMGDYAVGMFPVAKAQQKPPNEVAREVAAALPRTGLISSAEAVGPFVNVRVDRVAALLWLFDAASGREGRRLVPRIGEGKTVCIDYSSPNISKHLAYHHIRSTMLGHALVGLHEALGYRVVGINHLGDWGTTHGMLLAADAKWGAEYATLDIIALNQLYVRYREAMKTDPALEGEARGWFKRLEGGDPTVRARWQLFRDTSLAEFREIYDRVGVRFDDWNGESFYEDKMPEILDLLTAKGMLKESEGAEVVELPGEKTPLLIRTKDGTTLYATRDLAAALYRFRTYRFDQSLYVVDRGQSLHFRQLFKCLTALGFDWAARCEHIPFGLVRFKGKKTSTREGDVVLLKDVFREAIDQVRPAIVASDPALGEAEVSAVARQVGVGAVVFANVLPQRDKDVDFDWEKVLSLSGDSGPYLQYTHARCASIGRKAGGFPEGGVDPSKLGTDLEWAVGLTLLEFGEQVARAAAAREPHVLAHYLLDVAGAFSRWYTAGNGDRSLRVICDDPEVRSARLGLVRATQAVLASGLAVLGLAAPDAM